MNNIIEPTLKDKIYGSFAGVAVGDAMGMPFHELTPEEIHNRCNGLATTFYDIFTDEFIHLDYKAGQVTDDTTLTIVTANAILKYKGLITSKQFVGELAKWVKTNKAVWQHGNVYGPSTKAAFTNLLEGKFDTYLDRKRSWIFSGTSNGAIMRVSPAGWANAGKWQKAVELACAVILPTHPTDVALSAASGHAAAISHALTKDSTYISVIDFALKGAKAGFKIGSEIARKTAQRYPYYSLEYALELAEKAQDAMEASYLIRTRIGSHFNVSETMATAFGIFYASKGDFTSGIIAAVNNGGDTDTIASIVGALSGALNGIQIIPSEWVDKVEKVNHMDCELMSEKFYKLLNPV